MFNECIRVLCNVHHHPDDPVFKWNIYVAAPTGDDSVLDRAKWLSNAYPSDVFSYKHPDRDEIFLYRGKVYATLPLDILASVYKNSDMRYLVASFDTTIYPDPTDQLAPREWEPRLLTSSRAAADMYVKACAENCGRHSYILFWYDMKDDQSVYYSVDSYGLCVEHSPFKRWNAVLENYMSAYYSSLITVNSGDQVYYDENNHFWKVHCILETANTGRSKVVLINGKNVPVEKWVWTHHITTAI